MVGEHILKVLVEEPISIKIRNRWLICQLYPGEKEGIVYTVYERKPYAKRISEIIITTDEQKACQALTGEVNNE